MTIMQSELPTQFIQEAKKLNLVNLLFFLVLNNKQNT